MAERGKKVTLFFIEGTPTGRLKCELSNWTGVAYRIPHTMIFKADREELNKAGVYFLIGKDEDDITDKIYIGEAEDVLSRINQHIAAKDKEWQDWTHCVMFVSNSDALNKAKIKYLEHSLYTQAKSVGRCTITNCNTPTKSALSESDESEMEEYKENLILIMGAIGYKFFEGIETSVSKGNNYDDLLILRSSKSAYDASGKVTNDGFVVFKGSKINNTVATSFKNSKYQPLRERLITDKIIVNNEFVKDYYFSSGSAAASVIQGCDSNGHKMWKTANKKTLGEIMSDTSK